MPSASCACDEDVVPEPRLPMALELRQVEVRPAAACDRPLGRVEHVEPEVEQAARHRLAVDQHVALGQMPAARPDEQRRDLVVQAVALLARSSAIVRSCASIRFCWPSTQVRPGRRVRVLEVGHEDLRARVERVDHHLAVGRAGDLDAAVLEVGRRLGDLPVGRRGRPRVSGEEVRELAGEQAVLPRGSLGEQLLAAAAERRAAGWRRSRAPRRRGCARRARRGARRPPEGRPTWL